MAYYEELMERQREEGGHYPTKNTELLLNEAMNTVFKEIKARKVCMYCKEPMYTRIQALKNRIMMVTNQVAARSRRDGGDEKLVKAIQKCIRVLCLYHKWRCRCLVLYYIRVCSVIVNMPTEEN